MLKKLLIQGTLEFIALFLIFSGIDMLLGNEVEVFTNLLIALIFSVLKNLMGLKKYYVHNLDEVENNDDDEEEEIK